MVTRGCCCQRDRRHGDNEPHVWIDLLKDLPHADKVPEDFLIGEVLEAVDFRIVVTRQHTWRSWVDSAAFGMNPTLGQTKCEDKHVGAFQHPADVAEMIVPMKANFLRRRMSHRLDIRTNCIVPAAGLLPGNDCRFEPATALLDKLQ
ncbi:hypothetical protein D9M72_541860 [compost metagenome]